MPDSSSSAGHTPMEGLGVYNRSSCVQAANFSPALPLLSAAARSVPLAPALQPTFIADYGSSEGRNSLAPIAAAIRAVRDRAGAQRLIGLLRLKGLLTAVELGLPTELASGR